MTPPLPFGNLDAQACHPAIVADGSRIHLVWREFDGSRTQIRAMTSADRGDRWSAPTTLAQTAGAADDPLLLRGPDAVWLVWNTAADGLQRQRLQP